MYEYLKGIITVLAPKFVVIEVTGVGYRVVMGNPYRFTIGQEVQLFVEQVVREDAITLYGFQTVDEKNLFDQLLAVSGIGPKSALAILANADHSGLVQAIVAGNINYLTKFPGIGKKTAQQMVLDLQNNLSKLPFDFQNIEGVAAPVASTNPALDDALEALRALGYGDREVKKVEKALQQQPDKTTSDYISAGLKLLV